MDCALITGGLGFIGSHIARRLIAEKIVDLVVLLDHFGGYVSPASDDYHDYRRLRFSWLAGRAVIERAQANYPNVMAKLLHKYRPGYIFHLAALPLAKLDNIGAQEAIEGNVSSTANILEICANLKELDNYQPQRFVYASSSMIYGDFLYQPADENHPANPKSIYGAAKLAGEVITRGLAQAFGLKATIVRPSAVYGPTDMNRRVTQVFLEAALKGEKLIVRGKDEYLDFTYVEDLAKGFVLAATRPEAAGQTFNITAGQAYSLLEYVRILKRHFPNLKYQVVEREQDRPRRGTLSIEKAKKLLGYQPDHDLASGVAKYVHFARQMQGWPKASPKPKSGLDYPLDFGPDVPLGKAASHA